MHKTIISDTSCLIVLTTIGEIELLQKMYGTITTTIEVATEYGQSLPEIPAPYMPGQKFYLFSNQK